MHVFESITELIVGAVEGRGIPAVFLLMMIEAMCLPVPAEVTMMIAGVLVARGSESMFAMIATGVIGNVVGACLIWWVGRSGGRALIVKHGRWVGVREHHIEVTERWFDRHGIAAVIVTRCIPVVRTFASLPAGIAGMRFVPFSLATAAGCVPFVASFAYLGYFLGDNWSRIHDNFRYVNGAIIAFLVLAVLYYFVRRYRTTHPAAE